MPLEHIATSLSEKGNTSTEWSEATYWRTRRSRVCSDTTKIAIKSNLTVLGIL